MAILGNPLTRRYFCIGLMINSEINFDHFNFNFFIDALYGLDHYIKTVITMTARHPTPNLFIN